MVLDCELLIGTELFEDVVHFGESECRMKLLLALAMGIEALGYFANGLLLCFAGIWKWERVKARCLYIDRSVFQGTSSGKSPRHMNSTGQHSQSEGVGQSNVHEFVVCENA